MITYVGFIGFPLTLKGKTNCCNNMQNDLQRLTEVISIPTIQSRTKATI
jgi:hypothetical protein